MSSREINKGAILSPCWCSALNYIHEVKLTRDENYSQCVCVPEILIECDPRIGSQCYRHAQANWPSVSFYQEFCHCIMGDCTCISWGWRPVRVHSTEQRRAGTCLNGADCERFVTHTQCKHTHTPPQMFCLHTSQSQRDFEISARHFFFFYLWFMAKTSTWYKACQQKHFLHCLFTADNSSLMFPLKQSLLQSWSGQWTWLPLWEAWRCSPARLKAPCAITWPGAERVILSEPVRGGSRCFRTHPCRSVGCGLRMLGRTTVWPLTPTETAESPCGFSSQVR